MRNDMGPMAGGLLARLNPTGGPNNALLATDGGGSRQATDGGGRRRSGVVVDALTRTQAAIVRDSDEVAPGTKAAVGSAPPAKLRPPGSVATKRPLPAVAAGFGRYESWVRLDLVRTGLLGELTFDKGSVAYGGLSLYRLGRPAANLLADQAKAVAERATKREDRLSEIFVQADDLWPFWQAITRVESATAPRTTELMTLALQFATSVVMQLKDWAHVRRPSEELPRIVPIIDVPGHASLPSGHATSAYMLSGVLRRLVGLGHSTQADHAVVKLMNRLAFRVAYNREVAGVHFPIDSAAGRVLGDTLAGYFCSAATGGYERFGRARFLANAITPKTGRMLARATDDTNIEVKRVIVFAPDEYKRPPHPWLQAMWSQARDELGVQGLRYD